MSRIESAIIALIAWCFDLVEENPETFNFKTLLYLSIIIVTLMLV